MAQTAAAPPPPSRTADRLRSGWRWAVIRRLADRGPLPDRLDYRPKPYTPGVPERADRIFAGSYSFEGVSARAVEGDPWAVPAPSDAWAEALHGFGWLEDFRACSGVASRRYARRVTELWIKRCGRWHDVGWRPAITGDRVAAWCLSNDLLLGNAELVYRSAFLRALGAQTRYLARCAGVEYDPSRRLRAAIGLIYGALCLPGHRKHLKQGLEVLRAALAGALERDGGMPGRRPSGLLDLFEKLVQLSKDLDAGSDGAPAFLKDAIARMAPMLRAMRMPDGALSLFHGGREGAGGRLDRALAESGIRDPALSATAGYQRLSAGRMTVIFDVAAPPIETSPTRAHAGTLALEVGVGRRRLIVNCGSAVHRGAEWERALRGTAAHSTLCLNEESSSQFDGAGAGARLRSVPGQVESQRREDPDGVWALGSHDGYLERYGLIHYRRLYLNTAGLDLRGEDTLLRPESGRGGAQRDALPFAVRFHLHPDVVVEHDGDSPSVHLHLPGGDRWVMRQSGGSFALEESVYLGRAVAPRPTSQVVIRGAVRGDSAQVKWAFKRIDMGGPSPRDLERSGPDEALDFD